jgi:hypothetical protein
MPPSNADSNVEDDDDLEYDSDHGLTTGNSILKWEENFHKLAAFKEKHGHCLVPNRYPEDPQLGSWVSTQRRQYKIMRSSNTDSTAMTEERAKRLEGIDFQWSTKDPRHVPWDARYEELVAFVKKYGHSQVPIGWEKNIKLSNWVSTQRQEYKLLKKGRSSRLTDNRIDQLNKVSFVWEAQRGGPRRKRKASVSVPEKPNPVAGVGPVSNFAATRGGLAQAPMGNGGSLANMMVNSQRVAFAQPGFNNSNPVDLAAWSMAQMVGLQRLTEIQNAMFNPWQALAFGGFQFNQRQLNAAMSPANTTGGLASMFPIASPMPSASGGGGSGGATQFSAFPMSSTVSAWPLQASVISPAVPPPSATTTLPINPSPADQQQQTDFVMEKGTALSARTAVAAPTNHPPSSATTLLSDPSAAELRRQVDILLAQGGVLNDRTTTLAEQQ